jgi:simple sugar transport system permease protein
VSARGLAGAVVPPVLSVTAAVALGALLVLAIGESPAEVARVFVTGVLGTGEGIATILFNATSLAFTGLSVAFAYRAGLFNIGAEGQLTIGAFLATLVALGLPGAPALVLVPLAILAAAAGGAAWGAIPGLLRARLGVHEVINTIMLNFVASALTGYFVVHVLREPGRMIPQTAAIPEAARLPRLGEWLPLPPESPANAAFLLALLAAVAAAWLLARTPFGFRVRAIGQGERAARTCGVPTSSTIVGAMAVAGALAGLAGVNEVLGFRYRFLDNFAGGVGFLGIAVALLGRARPSGVVAAALLFGALSAGSLEIDVFTDVPREVALVVQAGILLFVVAGDDVARRLLARRARGSA